MTTVVATVSAAVLAGIFALVGARVGAANEHRAWLRSQRLESATEILAAADQLLSRLIDTPNPQRRWELCQQGVNDLIDLPGRTKLILVGNGRTEHVLRALIMKLGEHTAEAPTDQSKDYGSARSDFVTHVRRLIHT